MMAGGLMSGCMDPVEQFITKTDALPPSEQPPNWEETRRRMRRPAPVVGASAPDFSLPTVDGSETITRSQFHRDRPLVLIFGSFT